MSRRQNYNPGPYVPEYCWVGEKKKICYADEDEAELAARNSEYDHGLKYKTLATYHCEVCGSWHLAHANNRNKKSPR